MDNTNNNTHSACNKMKWAYWSVAISGLAVGLSVWALCFSFGGVGALSPDWASFLVAILAILVTVLVVFIIANYALQEERVNKLVDERINEEGKKMKAVIQEEVDAAVQEMENKNFLIHYALYLNLALGVKRDNPDFYIWYFSSIIDLSSQYDIYTKIEYCLDQIEPYLLDEKKRKQVQHSTWNVAYHCLEKIPQSTPRIRKILSKLEEFGYDKQEEKVK